jgi:hypothetical protein
LISGNQGQPAYGQDLFGAGAVAAAYGYPASTFALSARETGAGHAVYTLHGQYEAQWSDPNTTNHRKYPEQVLLQRGKIDSNTLSINITDMGALVRIYAVHGASVQPYELALCDSSILKFDVPKITADATERVIDTNLEKLRSVVREHYGKPQPYAVVSAGLSRHAFLLLQLADSHHAADQPPEVLDNLTAWASAYLQLVNRLLELRANVLVGEAAAATWGLGQVRTAARSYDPPDWSAEGTIFIEGKAALERAASSRAASAPAGGQPAQKMSAQRLGHERNESDSKRAKTASAQRSSSSAHSSTGAAHGMASRSSAAPRPDTTISHFQTALDPRTESLRSKADGLEFCKQFNSGRPCSRGDVCRFFHLCSACTTDSSKQLASCHHPQTVCPNSKL